MKLRGHVEWYIESLQAEADLRVAQAEFDKQAEITKLLLEGIQTAHVCFITIFNYCFASSGKSKQYKALAVQMSASHKSSKMRLFMQRMTFQLRRIISDFKTGLLRY